jgi:hypothetical protein
MAVFLVAILAATKSTQAVPITYVYEGIGTGTIGQTAFSSATYKITGYADTDNVDPWANADLINRHYGSTVEIGGVGIFVMNINTHTWIWQEGRSGGLGSPNLITINNEPAFNDIGYGLDTELGPVLDTTPRDTEQFHDISTSGGDLTFSTINNVVFTARFSTFTADFDQDGDVDGKDFLTLQRGYNPSCAICTLAEGDANDDKAVGIIDVKIWEGQFGAVGSSVPAFAVPEPSTLLLASLGGILFGSRRRRV